MANLAGAIFLSLLSVAAAFDLIQLGKELKCLQKCASHIPILPLSQDEVCRSWEKGKACTAECKLDIDRLLPFILLPVRQMIKKCDKAQKEFANPLGRIQCIRSCLQTVEEILPSDEQLTYQRVCSSFSGLRTCFSECAEGNKLFAIIEEALPNSVQLVEKVCSDPPEEETVSQEVSKQLQDELQIAAQLDVCSDECYKTSLKDFRPENFLNLCEVYSDFDDCVRECPKGDLIPKLLKEALPSFVKKVESICPKTTEDFLAAQLRPAGLTRPSLFEDALCAKNCLEFLIHPGIEGNDMTVAQMCNSMMETKRCLTSCKAGDAVVEFLRQIVPNLESRSEDICSGDPDEKPIDAKTEELLKLDSQIAAKTEACTGRCYQEHMIEVIQDVQSGCQNWLKFKDCMYQCPNGKAVVELTRNIIPKVMNIIQGVCEDPSTLIPESRMTGKCSEKTDKEVEYCRKVSKMAKEKYDDPARFCQWRGFTEICAKMCC